MRRLNFRMAGVLFALGGLVMSMSVSTEVQAQTPAVDPAATQILQRMTDYLGSLQRFSVHTQNTIEDVLVSGHKVDFDVSSSVTVSRPNKLRAERKGDLVDQVFYYDGTTLTLYNPSDKVYAIESAPGTIEELLDFAREIIGIIPPISDLMYRNAFTLLMQEVNLAVVIGKTVINGVTCDHLLFSRPGVDFQVWVADSGQPLPQKYSVTDTALPRPLSLTTVLSDWNVAPAVDDALFTFVPPEGTKAIIFLPLEPQAADPAAGTN